MNIEKFKELFEKYDLNIMVKGYDGSFFSNIDTIIKLFEKYGDDTKRYELEQIHQITIEEYEELKKLLIKETNWDGDEVNFYAYRRCSGINKNGKRCACLDNFGIWSYNHKKKLEILKTETYYCPKHKQQEDILLRKAIQTVYGR